MTDATWIAVEDYFNRHLVPEDPALTGAQARADAAGLPPIQVAPQDGKLLNLLARMVGARRILEIGTLAGYSTIWLARALPEGGRLVTLEFDPAHAAVANENIVAAGLANAVEVRIGSALDSLAALSNEGAEPFDLVFIDADKPNNPGYLAWSLKLTRPGSVIVADNVVREGAVADAASADPKVQGVRRFTEMLAADPRLEVTALQTVGSKGYDGFTIALVVEENG